MRWPSRRPSSLILRVMTRPDRLASAPSRHGSGRVFNQLDPHGYELVVVPAHRIPGPPKPLARSRQQLRTMHNLSPNFAYGHCVQYCTATDIEQWTLSQWRASGRRSRDGASRNHGAFLHYVCGERLYGPRFCVPGTGSRKQRSPFVSIKNSRGVRTTTLPQNGGGYGGRRSVVCVGAPVRDTKIRVIDGAGSTLPEGHIGEVVVSGPGVFRGYLNDTKATNEVLANGWLRTGDLGLIRDDELYVTGRLKDVLIVHGQEFYAS